MASAAGSERQPSQLNKSHHQQDFWAVPTALSAPWPFCAQLITQACGPDFPSDFLLLKVTFFPSDFFTSKMDIFPLFFLPLRWAFSLRYLPVKTDISDFGLQIWAFIFNSIFKAKPAAGTCLSSVSQCFPPRFFWVFFTDSLFSLFSRGGFPPADGVHQYLHERGPHLFQNADFDGQNLLP